MSNTLAFSCPVHLDLKTYQNNIDKVAIIDKNKSYTFWDIYSKSLVVQKLLESAISQDGTNCIAQLLPNDASYVIAQVAIWKTGNIVIPLHPLHPESQLNYFINDSKCSVIITNEDLASKHSSFLSNHKVIILERIFLNKEENASEKEKFISQNNPLSESEVQKLKESPALIVYTSGTTGPPKGAILTHGNIDAQVRSLSEAWEISSRDVMLHCLPLHHIHGIVNALVCPLACGARVILEPQFKAPLIWSKFLDSEAEISSRVSLFMAVPTIYVKLIDEFEKNLASSENHREFVKTFCTENIRLMVSGSAPLPSPVLEKWREITGLTLLERYGMSEIGMALSNPLHGERKPGELLVKGPNVFLKYWEKEEATKKEFTSDGWFSTGDTVAYIDGNYKILGRTSADIIKSGGFKVSALDVERELLSHPDIADVAVVGVPDDTWGERVAALVVLKNKPELDVTALRALLKEKIPYYQVPTLYKFLSEGLPRNAMGKVNKKELVTKFFPSQ
ncbi:Acyl-CoA synthetase family member 3, mitochondrial [Armadillidium nasatum]|uniref:Acyl-CoA synthetase family member 3, mitochondrial n=1 Tax=Armadillidium nasatum TaxID=96803 RepID=A0A5N5SNT0_9CRUS|nr:Acyl-CoA synthetase family member 3, mitochondrial [Armadillidium nasatum]